MKILPLLKGFSFLNKHWENKVIYEKKKNQRNIIYYYTYD
jgi:hypothetical protein